MKKLRQYRATFEKVAEGTIAVDPDRLGQRSKLGGDPDWEQYEEVPTCTSCKAQMTFVAQIDSIEHDEASNPHRIDCLSPTQEYMFGDVGMIYVFLCFECLESKSVVQCY